MTLTKIKTGGIQDDAVTSGKIPANAVGSSELADNAVDTAAIADQAVTLAKLEHGTSSNSGKFLRANNGADPTFETVNTDLVSDTTPQLGGDLDTNDFNIKYDNQHGPILGNNGDGLLYHTGSSLHLLNSGGSLNLNCDTIHLRSENNTETYLKGVKDGAVELRYNNSKKFETNNDGVIITGDLNLGSGTLFTNDNGKLRLGGSQDLEIYHDSNDSIISDLGAGSLLIRTNGTAVEINKTASEYMARFICDGAVQLYHNNSKKLETTSTGSTIHGVIRADTSMTGTPHLFSFGRGGQATSALSLYGAESAIEIVSNDDGTHGGSLLIRTVADGAGFVYNPTDNALELKLFSTIADNFGLHGAGSNVTMDTQLRVVKDGAVELYYNGTKQLETKSPGINVIGHVHATLTGSQISSGDPTAGDYLMLYHDGSNGYIQNGSGGITIRDVSGGNIEIQATDGETSILCNHNGAVELYYDNSKKFQTNGAGVDIFENLYLGDNVNLKLGTGADLQIYHTGTASKINNATGSLLIQSDAMSFHGNGGSETMAVFAKNGAVELYYDNSKKFETFSGGVRVHGELLMQNNSLYLNDNAKLRLGTGQDFNIFHDGTDNIFQSSGLHNFIFKPKDTDVGLKIIGDGGVELYYDNGKKLETTLTGVSITGNTLAVKPVKTIVNTNQDHSSNLRFQISLPNTSRMFKITGTFSFSGNGSGHIYADFGDWSDSHTANLEGVSYQIREGGNSTLEDVGNSRYHRVTASGFDFFNLEVLYEITLTTVAFANGNDTGTQNGGARPGAFGFIKYTHPSIGCALTTFTFQDIAASGTDRLQSFAWDIDGASGSVGNGEHTYVVEEYPLT